MSIIKVELKDFLDPKFPKILANRLKVEGSLVEPIQLKFDGFDNDPRELCEIPEFRRFIKKVNKQFNGWLTPRVHKETVKLVITTLTYQEVMRKTNQFSFQYAIDRKKWFKLISEFCRRSEFGLDCGAQYAFTVFPEMLPDHTDEYDTLKGIFGQAYKHALESSEFAKGLAENNKYLIVENIRDGEITLNVYTKKDKHQHTFPLSKDDLEIRHIGNIISDLNNKV